jgi:poly-gamma-glutamate synthesis protein (capsule biosynthesis protein)
LIKLKAVGDICPGDSSLLGHGVCSLTKRFGNDFPLKYIKSELKNTDILLGNLEGLLTKKIENSKRPNLKFCGLPTFGQELAESGFNVLNMANNHIFEHGPEVFKETIHYLRELKIEVCGLRDNSGEYYSMPVIIEKGDLKLGIIGYNWVGKDKFLNADEFIAQSHDSVVNYTWLRNKSEDECRRTNISQMNKNVIRDIKKLKSNVDIVILVTHWGFELVSYTPYGVIMEGHSFVEAGADLVIGVHSHVIQGYEIYKNGSIFYSLGNFVFDMPSKLSRFSVILECDIDKYVKPRFNLKAVHITKHFQPCLADESTRLKIEDLIKSSSRQITSKDNKNLLDDDKVYKKFEEQYNFNKKVSILYHFYKALVDPVIWIVIFKKVIQFIQLLALRFRGKKIRW